MRARDIDERDDRQPDALGELHDAHRLAVALGVRHAEVAPDVLVGVGALLLADDDDPPAADARETRDDRRVVAEQPVAVQLEELVGHGIDELERPRPAQAPASWTRAHTSSRAAASGRAIATAPSGATAGTVTGVALASGSASSGCPSPFASSPTRSAIVVRNENGRKARHLLLGLGLRRRAAWRQQAQEAGELVAQLGRVRRRGRRTRG